MNTPIDYAAIRASVEEAKRLGLATSDGSDPKAVKKNIPPEPINPILPDWLLESLHATREATDRREHS